MDTKSVDPTTCDLSVKNPIGDEEIAHRSPATIIDEIAALDAESAEVLEREDAKLAFPSKPVAARMPGERTSTPCSTRHGGEAWQPRHPSRVNFHLTSNQSGPQFSVSP